MAKEDDRLNMQMIYDHPFLNPQIEESKFIFTRLEMDKFEAQLEEMRSVAKMSGTKDTTLQHDPLVYQKQSTYEF